MPIMIDGNAVMMLCFASFGLGVLAEFLILEKIRG